MNSMAIFIGLCVMLSGAGCYKFPAISTPRVVDVKDDFVQAAAKFAVDRISQKYGRGNKLGLVQVMCATLQVVEGQYFRIALAVGRIVCPETPKFPKTAKTTPKPPKCSIPIEAKRSDHPDYYECYVEVRDQAWVTPRYKLYMLECTKPKVAAPLFNKYWQ